MNAPDLLTVQPGIRSAWRAHGLPPGAVAGAAMVALLVLLALAAPWIAPDDPLAQHLGARLEAPSLHHLCGTDGLGRDLLSRLLYGGRATLGLVALVALFMVPLGLTVGIVAGFCGGWVDRVLSGLINLVMAFPALVLALAFVGMLGPGLINAALALILTGWPAYARLARAETRVLRDSDYIAAAQMQGIGGVRLLWGHVLPACVPTMQIRLALDLASTILSAAALGFLGLGIRPPTPEWGMMIAEGSRVVFDHWWVAGLPGATIFAASLAFNLVADGLRNRLDPRHA
jgi:peptide/nickel transport system permease protein